MATATFQQNVGGYTGTVDTFLRESRPGNNYLTATEIDVDGVDKSNGAIQGLLSFTDIFGDGPNQIALGATITSATLTLSVNDGTNEQFSLYRMAQDWTSVPSMTWNSFGGGIQTDGVEALSAPDVTTSGLSSGLQTIDVTQSLQAWSDGLGSFGWLMSISGSNGIAFSSSEGGSAPILSVTYEIPTDPVPGLTVVESAGTTIVTEGGDDDTVLIALKSAPISDVTITVSTNGPGDVGFAPSVLTFTPLNWQTQQAVVINATNDTFVEPSETFNVTLTASSADAAYNGLTSSLSVEVMDNDIPPPAPGLAVTESGGATVIAEGGAGDNILISLDSAPISDVTISMSTTGAGDIGFAPSILTFTPSNWQTQQSFALGAIDDTLIEGTETFNVTLTAASADAAYNGMSSSVSLTVIDNDAEPLPFSPYVVAIHETSPYSAGDPSGLAYVPELDLMFIADSEHDESPYNSPINLFAIRLDGTFVDSYSMLGFTKEPTGLAYNPFNGLLYVSDDDAKKIFLVDPNDPTTKVGEINVGQYGIIDGEDPAIDPVTGHIYLLSGSQKLLVELSATGDFIQSKNLPSQIKDAEALAYDASLDVFYIASGATRGTIFQTDHDGNILATSDILNDYRSPITGGKPKIKGFELAPSSDPNDGDKMSLYAANYGNDQVMDGRLFEIDLFHDWLVA